NRRASLASSASCSASLGRPSNMRRQDTRPRSEHHRITARGQCVPMGLSGRAVPRQTARMLRDLSLACMLTSAVARQRIEFRTEAYPLQGTVEIGKERWLAQRVVDAITGAPIAGAQWFLVPEDETPLPGRFWSARSATSDQDGFVRVRLDDLAAKTQWMVVRAAGH